jgi:hypothetical protein
MALLPLNHFLSLPRPDVFVGPPAGVVDTTTLAAHDFDVDTRTGFMPPDPPLTRLPAQWELWEQLLDGARLHRLQLGSKVGITEEEKARSEPWRARVSQVRYNLHLSPSSDIYRLIRCIYPSYPRYPQLSCPNQSCCYDVPITYWPGICTSISTRCRRTRRFGSLRPSPCPFCRSAYSYNSPR